MLIKDYRLKDFYAFTVTFDHCNFYISQRTGLRFGTKSSFAVESQMPQGKLDIIIKVAYCYVGHRASRLFHILFIIFTVVLN